jgi:phosphate transporter
MPSLTQAIPLFVTSLAVPFLVVVLRVLRSTDGKDERLSANDATKCVASGSFAKQLLDTVRTERVGSQP